MRIGPKAINARGLIFSANESVDRATIEASVFSGDTSFLWRIAWAVNSTVFTLLPASGSELDFDTSYRVVLTGVQDLLGNRSADLQINFTTKPQPTTLPTISRIFPAQGSTGGGTELIVRGLNFDSDVLVTIGGTPVSRIVSNIPDEIKVITAPGVSGVRDVTVFNADGESAVLTDAYTFIDIAPAIRFMSPNSGSTVGGTEIVIVGENFILGTTATMGGLPITDLEFFSDRLLSGIAPPNSAGAKTVEVVGPNNQRATLVGGYVYKIPPPEALLPAKYKATVVAAVIQNGEPVLNVTLAFSRSISGRKGLARWFGSTGPDGRAVIDIREDPFGEFMKAGASGMYQIVAVDEDFLPLDTWHSIPIRGEYSTALTLTVGGVALVTDRTRLVDQTEMSTSLLPNFPNPFNPATQISYELAQAGSVQLVIYNTLGQQVRTLVDRHQALGRYHVAWDGKNSLGHALASGVYIYHLKTAQAVQTRRMLLLK